MSLLNEMLKDLTGHKTRKKLPFALIVRKKSSLLKKWHHFIPVALIMVSLTLVLFLFISHRNKLAPATAVAPRSVVLTQPVITKSPALVKPVDTQTVGWMPSVLVSVPFFDAHVLPTDFANTMDEPLYDEEYANNGVNKVFNNLSPKDWYEEEFNKALDAIESGDVTQATYRLEAVIMRLPKSTDARESLAAIYFSQGQYAQAMTILNDGLTLDPNALNLNIMKARMLYDQNKTAEALTILERFHPDMHEEPDFYGLLAAALQTAGRINEAGALYRSLVEVEPSNGQYWLGYGIALENKDQLQQAIQAYKKASDSYELDPSIRTYAEDRLKSLQG